MNLLSTTIANQFIKLANTEDYHLNPMKLQRLVYIAHGFHLALFETKLTSEYPRACQYGPVFKSLKKKLQKYGADSIPHPIKNTPEFPIGAKKTQELIEGVWIAYGKKPTATLLARTNIKGGPWQTTYLPDEELEIRNADIKLHFQQLTNKTEN